MSLTQKMSEAHEAYLADVFDGRRTRGSGNQWANPADGRMDRRESPIAWAWDGKSTRARSITITRAMLDKITEQAGAERPLVPIRFYDDDRLRSFEDWAVVRVDDLVEMLSLVTALRTMMEGHA